EGRWAEITREMRLTGNYFWPTINGTVYYDKPLLSYWLVSGAAFLTGNLDELATRLPSAVAGLLGVALLMLLTRRFYDLRTAVAAGLILATSYSYALFSRIASADIETVAGVLAVLVLFLRNEEQQKGWWVVAFWLTMSLTSLTKGLLGFVLPLLVIGVYSIFAEGWDKLRKGVLHGKVTGRLRWLTQQCGWLFQWRTLPAAVVALTVYFLPFAVSYAQMHSDIGFYKVFRENVTRFFNPFDHQEPVYFYLYRIFMLVAPWSVFLPAALVQAHSTSREKGDRFILAYFWATFLFFNFSGSRRDYYLLPVLPAAAVLIARLFTTAREMLDRRARKLMELGYVLIAVLVMIAGALALFPPAMRPGVLNTFPVLPERAMFAVVWAFMLAAVIFALIRLHPERIVFSSAVLAYLGLLFLFVFALPGAERYRGEKGFAQAVRARLNGEVSRVVLYRVGGPGLLFYLSAQEPIPQYDDGMALAHMIENNSDRWIIALERDLLDLRLRGFIVAREESLRWDRPASPRGHLVLFRPDAAVRKEGKSPYVS
ncbi:phospholipid carrier-dependent glycosyltransferase, partial [bacterium]